MSDSFLSRYQRDPTTSSSSSSSRAVGRIAEVVAAARASLQDPSRPHTPQTLDQKMLSSSSNISSFHTERNLSSLSHTTMQKKILTRRRMEGLLISESLSIPLSLNNMETPLSSRPSTSSSSISPSPRYEENDKNEASLSSSSSQLNSQYENAIKSSLQELFDFLVSSETLLQDDEAKTESFQDFLSQLKGQFNQIYQKLRLINTKEQFFSSILHKIAITELSLIHSSLWKILNIIGDSYVSWSLKAQIYILILRFFISSINKGENFVTSSGPVLSVQFLIKEFLDNKPGNKKTLLDHSFNDEEDPNLSYNHDQSREDLSEEFMDNSIHQSILLDQLHLSIETFRFIFSCLEETLYYYYNNSVESCSPRIPYSSRYIEISLSTQLLQKNSIDKILEIAYQTTAWVRSLTLSNDSRRRAIYHGIAEVTLSTLRICCCIKLTNQDVNNSNEKNNKVHSLIAQLLSLIRNLVNDKNGRERLNEPNQSFFKKTRLSNSLNIISCLNLLLYKYKSHPIVVMNVVRVLAVMSQFEAFRTLIRASSSYLSEIVSQPSTSKTYDELNGIIGVIKYEADLCKSIMEDSEENSEVTEWPTWNTWPVISRACYTLGNITMMNAKIRKVIGIKLDITSSLVLLLQVSANSLLRIHQQHEKISLNNGSSIFTVHNKGNEVYNVGGVDTIFSFLAKQITENNRINTLKNEKETKNPKGNDEDSSDYEIDDTSEMELRDAVIKLIRLLSNLSIDEQIGATVGVRQDLIQSLYELLLIAQNNNLSIITSSEYQYEELQLNIIAALTNLTFYTCQALNNKEDQLIKQQKEQQTKVVSKTLVRFDRLLTRLSISLIDSIFHSNHEIVLEATRVLGNLTRRIAPIEALVSRRVDEALLMISQMMINKLKANPNKSYQAEDPLTSEYEISQSCIGILINFSALPHGRYKILMFPSSGSVRNLSIFEELLRFLKILSPFYHVSLAVLITQVIFNILSSLEFRKIYIKNYSDKNSQGHNFLISDYYDDLPENIKKIPNTLNEWIELGEEDFEGNVNTTNEYKQLVQVSNAIEKLF